MSKVNYRAYLEVSNDDGTTVFYATEEILKSPDLQKRCSRKENAAEHHQAAAQGRMAGRAGASPWRRIKALTGAKSRTDFSKCASKRSTACDEENGESALESNS